MTYPTPVATESRSRVGISWFATEADALAATDYWRQPQFAGSVADANIGIVQVGRCSAFDRTVDGQRLYAVVTP